MQTLDLDAPILPGHGAAGLMLGESAARLPAPVPTGRRHESAGRKCHDFGAVLAWVRDGIIEQITLLPPYRGRIGSGSIGLGSTLREVSHELGPLLEDEHDYLVVEGMPGLSFETGMWRGVPGCETVEENLDANVTEIHVWRP